MTACACATQCLANGASGMAMPNDNSWLNHCYCIRGFSARNNDTTWKSAYIKHYLTTWTPDRVVEEKPAPYDEIYPQSYQRLLGIDNMASCYDTCISKEANGATIRTDSAGVIGSITSCYCYFGSRLWFKPFQLVSATNLDGKRYWKPLTSLDV